MIYSNLFILQLKRPRIRDRKEKLFRVIEHVRRAEPDLDSISTLLGLILPENKTDYMLAGSPDTDIKVEISCEAQSGMFLANLPFKEVKNSRLGTGRNY